jgi:OOP family OmpA-OmpF porin
MRRSILPLAIIAGTILAAHDAAAQGAWYVSGSAGAVLPSDFSRSITIEHFATGAQGPGTNTTTYNAGETVNLALGYRLPLGFRVEGELGYLHYGLDTIDPLSTNGMFPSENGSRLSNPSGGSRNLFTATANLFYDLPVSFAGITPYIGGGAGYYHENDEIAVFKNNFGGTFTQLAGAGGNAIILGEVGASYALTPALSLVTSYRYDYLFNSSQSGRGENILKLGVRYTFGAPLAPAVVTPVAKQVPAPAAARSFLVFFDWDKATLTDRARQIVAEAASTSAKVDHTRIEVNGYTDTSGTPAYNQGLSIRRAQTIAAELVKDGVPQTAISIQGFGETHLLVPTGAGVREPQNRRVEIIIR